MYVLDCLASDTCNGNGECASSGACSCDEHFAAPNCANCVDNFFGENCTTCMYKDNQERERRRNISLFDQIAWRQTHVMGMVNAILRERVCVLAILLSLTVSIA